MTGFQVPFDSGRAKRDIDKFLDGALELFKATKGLARINRRTAGGIVLDMMTPLDEVMERFARNCGEAGETTVANYWGAKALAFGFVGKTNEGRTYFAKSRERRTGGVFAEWNDEFYR